MTDHPKLIISTEPSPAVAASLATPDTRKTDAERRESSVLRETFLKMERDLAVKIADGLKARVAG